MGEKLHTKLERGLGLKEATALNMIDMIGIGPFIVLPIVIKEMNGPQSMLAWVLGALLAFMDGFVWSELGAAMPGAGGSYVFLKEIYGPKSWGKLFSFLLIWQTIFQAPLVVASGAIGFSQYFTFLFPLSAAWQKIVSGLLVIAIVVLLYRRIATVGKISLFLWIGVIATMLWLIFGGATHFNPKLAFDFPKGAFDFSFIFFVGLGSASVQTIYTYLGYYNICNLGEELKEPQKNIPRSIFISIAGIAVLYLAMQLSVLGVIPWREAMNSKFIVSSFVEKIYGSKAAVIATVLILWIAFSSLFSALLGYSRIPYAAAVDGTFFKIFSRVHPKKHFPNVSLLTLGAIAFIFSLLFRLKEVISAILAMRILVQFIGQAVGIILLRKKKPAGFFPFKMWLYPLPALVAILMWLGLFFSTGMYFALGGILIMLIGTIVFFVRAFIIKDFPFTQ
ncbi:MAG TPA: amino acid permease [Ignavibacteriaceae bacterium]|nr:amino acid permease [Ignavibacteriaceae bacterium]